jgi:hypothetical protein
MENFRTGFGGFFGFEDSLPPRGFDMRNLDSAAVCEPSDNRDLGADGGPWESLNCFVPDFNYLQAAQRAPRTENGVDEIAAKATHVQCAGVCRRLALRPLLRRPILKDDNDLRGTALSN